MLFGKNKTRGPLKSMLFLMLVGIGTFSFGQIEEAESTVGREDAIGQESVVVEREFEPKVEAAEKIKQTPQTEAPDYEKITVEYDIKDIEAASDFETSTLGAEEIPVEDEKPYRNYIRGAYGNRASLNTDAYLDFELNESQRVGADFSFSSTKGDIKGVDFKTGSTTSKLEGFFINEYNEAQLKVNGGFNYGQYNMYGLSNPDYFFDVDRNKNIAQTHYNFYATGNYKRYDDIGIKNINVKTAYLTGNFKTNEFTFDTQALFGMEDITELDWFNGINIGVLGDVNANYSNSTFSDLESQKFNYLTLGAAPYAQLKNEKFTGKLGANFQYNNLLNENDEFYVFPKIELFYDAIPQFGIYGGVKGGLDINRYGNLLAKNPYLFPSQDLLTTINKWDIFAGIRGDLGERFKYDTWAGFQNKNNMPFFVKAPFNYNVGEKSYNLLNTFSVWYDDGQRMYFNGSLQYIAMDNLTLGGKVGFQAFTLDTLEQPFEEPNVTAEINGDIKFWNDKLLLGSTLYFVGPRKGFSYSTPDNGGEVSLNAYIDLNANATYLINDRWSVFINSHNLLNNNYYRFTDYAVQGFQILGGVQFKF